MQDKNVNANNKAVVVCMDLQAVLLCPRLKVSGLYYKTKLALCFTIYEMSMDNATGMTVRELC